MTPDLAWTSPDADTRLLFAGASPNFIARGDRRPSGLWLYRSLLPAEDMQVHIRAGKAAADAEDRIARQASAWFRAVWA